MAEMAEGRKTRVAEPEAPVMVRMECVSKKFGSLRALDQVSFSLRKGEVLGFLGPNGAGKTTAMRILSGYFPPTEGRVWIGGDELFKNSEQAKKRIGYVPEALNFYGDMRVSEFLDFVAQIKSVPSKIRHAHIEEKIERCGLPEVGHRLIGQLSRGFRQRLGLAQALIGDPDVLLLDEPTGGLDPKQIKEIRHLIRELGRERTLILSTHILPEVSMVCDKVMIFNQGRVVATGTADELESGLRRERYEIFVVMGDRHRKDDALAIFHALPGVDGVTVLEEQGDRVSFSLFAPRGTELRPVISKLFVEQNIPLLEIRASKLSLEQIFLKIVLDEQMAQQEP
ncbi:MAG: ABC transporter ATP-binding protein [Candidatus Omnitrophica bacterium]|nr:ABC transporter ATP-binding protein [Candidatus Omnitrophota bacterium]MDD5672451.1 ABC transporter ATP-binding protein [Candidatus Omnitrophota bacterium]